MRYAIIPARGGSRRIPRKNIRLFHGKPIIAYSIEAADASDLFDHVIVSTDDKEIADVAQQYGADVLIRPARLAVDAVGTQEVTQAALKAFGIKSPSDDLCCCIYATAPLITPQDLIMGHTLLWASPACYVVAVGTEPLADAGAFYWGTVDNFLWGTPLYSTNTRICPLPSARVCDINHEHDWLRAESAYAELHKEPAAPMGPLPLVLKPEAQAAEARA